MRRFILVFSVTSALLCTAICFTAEEVLRRGPAYAAVRGDETGGAEAGAGADCTTEAGAKGAAGDDADRTAGADEAVKSPADGGLPGAADKTGGDEQIPAHYYDFGVDVEDLLPRDAAEPGMSGGYKEADEFISCELLESMCAGTGYASEFSIDASEDGYVAVSAAVDVGALIADGLLDVSVPLLSGMRSMRVTVAGTVSSEDGYIWFEPQSVKVSFIKLPDSLLRSSSVTEAVKQLNDWLAQAGYTGVEDSSGNEYIYT